MYVYRALHTFAVRSARIAQRRGKKKGDSGSILHHLNYFEQMKIFEEIEAFLVALGHRAAECIAGRSIVGRAAVRL